MNQYVWYTNHSIYSDVNIYNHYLSLSYILTLQKMFQSTRNFVKTQSGLSSAPPSQLLTSSSITSGCYYFLTRLRVDGVTGVGRTVCLIGLGAWTGFCDIRKHNHEYTIKIDIRYNTYKLITELNIIKELNIIVILAKKLN